MADIKFAEFMAETAKEAKTIEMPDGKVIELPAIELAPDAFFEAARAEDHIGMVRALLGEDQYAMWTGAGGNAMSLLSIYAKVYNVTLPNS